jgi:hypothetical protein
MNLILYVNAADSKYPRLRIGIDNLLALKIDVLFHCIIK